jgi:CspA family cold shock protein
VQGVIRSYDPQTREGVVVRDTDREEFTLALDALDHSIFRLLRQGQRVVFDLDDSSLATKVRIGAEVDMGLPTAEV